MRDGRRPAVQQRGTARFQRKETLRTPAFAKTIFKNPKLAVAQTVGFLAHNAKCQNLRITRSLQMRITLVCVKGLCEGRTRMWERERPLR